MDVVVAVPAAFKSKQLENPPPSSLGAKRKILDSFTQNGTPQNPKWTWLAIIAPSDNPQSGYRFSQRQATKYTHSVALLRVHLQTAELGKRCGYFGPKGRAILTSAIDHIISEALHPDQIFQTTASLIDAPHKWDKGDPNSEMIYPSDFIDYILVPHAAAVLISYDLEINFEAALKVLSARSDFGDVSNPVPDGQNTQNSGPREIFVRTPSPVPPAKPSKMSKGQIASVVDLLFNAATDLILAGLASPIRNPKTTTLASFPPPRVSKKNSAKEDSGPSSTRDAKKKGKKASGPAVVHSYSELAIHKGESAP
ncbi:hypothetical protein B0H11DRAFT_2251779 [Mycena galericulata]|nr:hypothetical protein B0H11DRAFT_2251779 [Mycena galericulata]